MTPDDLATAIESVTGSSADCLGVIRRAVASAALLGGDEQTLVAFAGGLAKLRDFTAAGAADLEGRRPESEPAATTWVHFGTRLTDTRRAATDTLEQLLAGKLTGAEDLDPIESAMDALLALRDELPALRKPHFDA